MTKAVLFSVLLLAFFSCKPKPTTTDASVAATNDKANVPNQRQGLKSQWLMPWEDSKTWTKKWEARLAGLKANNMPLPMDASGNVTVEARSMWYNTPQGSFIFPIEMYLSLKTVDGTQNFASRTNLSRFGFIYPPDSDPAVEGKDSKYSIQGLPLGFVRELDARPEMKGATSLGITCAACHTGEIVHNNTRFVIDGGQPLTNYTKYQTELVNAIEVTRKDPMKMEKMLAEVAKRNPIYNDKALFTSHYDFAADYLVGRERRNKVAVEGGPGRLDAVTQLLNELAVTHLKMDETRNTVRPAAPISYPHLWSAPDLACVQTNCLARNPLTRNMGEVSGVYGYLRVYPNDDAHETMKKNLEANGGTKKKRLLKFIQTVEKGVKGFKEDVIDKNFPVVETGSDLFKLFWLEDALVELPSPKWENAFGANSLNKDLVEKGKDIYFNHKFTVAKKAETCSSCHVIADINLPESQAANDTSVDPAKKKFLKVRQIKPDVVGTDITFLSEAGTRTFDTNQLPLSIKFLHDLALKKVPNPLEDKVSLVVFGITNKFALDKWIKDNKISDTQLKEMTHYHSNSKDFAAGFYKSRPLNGIAFASPYLHNGSVPSLEELFKTNRVSTFKLGSLSYDTEKVGYKTENADIFDYPEFVFDTKTKANSNVGHTWGTDLSEEDKKALIEYLKTL